ncbi:MAG: hypothetical protein HY043_02520 [Verrucomicrobia bacterium]|nr:hypothetical protein [Verrucomicrobiota bacterium]MBI3728973.1 hypothetical protein [Burkholderiales bacterium]
MQKVGCNSIIDNNANRIESVEVNATTIETLRAESTKLKRQAKRIDDLIAEFVSESDTKEIDPSAQPMQAAGVSVNSGKKLDLAGKKQPDACFQVLKDAATQLTRKEIYKRAIERGAKIPSEDHLSPVLSRDDRFENAGRGIWKLAKDQ